MKVRSVRSWSLLVAVLAIAAAVQVPRFLYAIDNPCCGRITPAGHRLAGALDAANVESLWLAHEHVNWETGEPDRGGDYEGPGKHTHCSAFAAAIAKRLGVYLLHPPEHGQLLLANAQAQWLRSEEAVHKGWRGAHDAHEAQAEANRGNLVVVVFANPDKHEPGHVAIVRPSEKSVDALERDGPQIIQAGQHNHASTVVRIGFANHAGAFPDGVRYYVHELDPPR
ncbi:MAG: hypothetical protein ACLPHP_21650 [Candidatus Sulfotelmatobacter sp.]